MGITTRVTTVYADEPKTPDFTICVLLYGDHLDLAKRCIEPILQLPKKRIELRIGCNAIGPATQDWLDTIFDIKAEDCHSAIRYSTQSNIGKYPMMRNMFHDPNHPIHSPYIMWFDDDSYITTPTNEWLNSVGSQLALHPMCGCIMGTTYAGNQTKWIQMQPWYKGRGFHEAGTYANPIPVMPWFAVGGFWAIRPALIQKLDWPPKNIIHRGGDVMLGEALYQHNIVAQNFYQGVVINADKDGNAHKAPRRGMDPLSVGIDYEPPLTVALHIATKDIDPKLLDYPGL